MVRYICHPQVSWTVEATGANLIRSDTKDVWTLDYPDAAIWDLVSRDYPVERIIRVLAAVASLDPESARQMVLDKLKNWARVGILIRVDEDP